MRHYSAVFFTTLLGILFVGLSGCAPKEKSISQTRPLLGGEVTITIYDKGQTRESLQPAFDEAFRVMSELEAKILLPGPENELEKLSANAGGQSVPLSPAVFDLTMEALRLYDQTEKVFDIRVKPMLDAYGFGANPRVPDDSELDTLKNLVAEGGLFVAGKSVLLSKKGMGFTLYKIGPGFLLDQAASSLADKGIQTATIQAGRLIRLKGQPPHSQGFPVTIVDPSDSKSLGTLHLPAGGYALVANDEGLFEKEGKKYHRLLDPRSGKPANLCTAFAVSAKNAAEAQALALSAFILGPTDGLKLLEKFPNASGLTFYEKDGKPMRKGTGPFESLSSP
ncbi:MAG: FAD:protein FMN transferase [bacterium]